MKNLSPSRRRIARVLGTVCTALTLCAAFFAATPARAQQPDVKTRSLDQGETKNTRVVKTNDPDSSNRYAIVIGVDNYKSLTQLAGAGRDAENLAAALKKYAEFRDDHVWVMTSKSSEDLQPTSLNILKRLGALKDMIPTNGLLFIFFAGHGVDQDGTSYLMPSDAPKDRSLIWRYAISEKDFRNYIQQSGAGQVVVVLDACRDDPFAGNNSRGGTSDNPLSEKFAKGFDFSSANSGIGGGVTLYAAKVGEKAFEDERTKQGFFTTALVEALSTQKVADDDGRITLGAVMDWVKVQVPTRARLVGGADTTQHPWEAIQNYDMRKLVISHVEPKRDPVAGNEGAKGTRPTLPVPPTTGKLTFNSSVPGGTLQLLNKDGAVVKEVALASDKQEAVLDKLQPGVYGGYTYSRDGYETEKYTEKIEIKAGENQHFSITPKPKTFTVTISTNVAAGMISYKAVGDAKSSPAFQVEDGKTLPPLPKGTYEYEFKPADPDFPPKSGTFDVTENATLDLRLERTSTSHYSLDSKDLNSNDWTAPGLLVKNHPYSFQIGGQGITYLKDDKYQHYADFRLRVGAVQMDGESAASFAFRVQDKDNYYLAQLTGAKSDRPYSLRVFAVQGGTPKELASVDVAKYKSVLSGPAQFGVVLSVTGQKLDVQLSDETGRFASVGTVDLGDTFKKGGVGFGSLNGEKFEVLGVIDLCVADCLKLQ